MLLPDKLIEATGGFCINLRTYMKYDRDEDWQDNDGALNTVSMTHPRIPVEHPNHLVVDDSECQPLQTGIWFAPFVLNFKLVETSSLSAHSILAGITRLLKPTTFYSSSTESELVCSST